LDGFFTAVRERQVSVPRLQFLLLIEPDDDNRTMYAERRDTFGSTLLAVDTTDDGLIRGNDAVVFVHWIHAPGSRTPKYKDVYRREMVL
jgi:hypothetical protein